MRIRQFKYKAQLLTKGLVEINKRHVNTNSFSKFPFSFFLSFLFRPVHIVYVCFNNVAISLYNVDRFGNRRRKKDQKLKKNKCWEKRWQK